VGLETVKDVIADLNKLWLRFVINDFDCRFGNKIFTLIQQTQIAIDAFKENKIRNQSVDILARQENQIPVAIADMQKRNISVKFLESILLLLRHSGFGC
jgi:hypothetical protein